MQKPTDMWFRYLSKDHVITEGLRDIGLPEFVIDYLEEKHAEGLITDEEVEDLKKEKDNLMSSEMYKYVMQQALVQPAMAQLRKLEKQGKYDPQNPKSQISPEQANEIIEKLKARWNGMSKSRKANDARRAMQGNLEFLSRDTSVAG